MQDSAVLAWAWSHHVALQATKSNPDNREVPRFSRLASSNQLRSIYNQITAKFTPCCYLYHRNIVLLFCPKFYQLKRNEGLGLAFISILPTYLH